MFLNYDVLQHIFDNSDYFTMLNMLKLNKGLNKFIDTKRLKALTTIKKILNRKGIACKIDTSHSMTFWVYYEYNQKSIASVFKGISVFGKDITKITIQAVNYSTLYVFHFLDANYVYINHLEVLLYKLICTNIRIIVESKETYKVAIHTQKEQNVIQGNYIVKWHTCVKFGDNIKQNELIYWTGACSLRYAS
jgi:hypothetical protein